MRARKRLLLPMVVALLAVPTAAWSLTPSLNAQRFQPAAGPGGFAVVEVARVLPAWHPSAQLVVSYGHRPAAVASSSLERRGGLVDGLFATHLRLALGITDFIEIDLAAPILHLAAAGDLLPGLDPGPQASSGDLEIAGRFRVLDESIGVGVVLSPFVTLPTGRRAALLTRGVPTLGARAAVSARWELLRGALNVGYRFVPSGSVVRGAVSDDELLLGAAIGLAVPTAPVTIAIEATGAIVVGGKRAEALAAGAPAASLAPGELLGSARIQLPAHLSLLVGGGAGLAPSIGVPQVRGFVGIDWVASAPLPAPKPPLRAADVDGDGVRDEDDLCPSSLEDMNGFEDEDGCPEGDVVLIRGDRVVLLEPVRYAGVTRLADSASGILGKLAVFLIEHPDLDVVRIEGHTQAEDKEMSRMRAVAVMLRLVEAGVDPERLEAVGYGSRRPVKGSGPRDRIEVRILQVAAP